MISKSPPSAGFLVSTQLVGELSCSIILFLFLINFFHDSRNYRFDFKISKSFQEWAAVYDSDENKAMLKAGGITSLYRGLNKVDSSRAIVVFQA